MIKDSQQLTRLYEIRFHLGGTSGDKKIAYARLEQAIAFEKDRAVVEGRYCACNKLLPGFRAHCDSCGGIMPGH